MMSDTEEQTLRETAPLPYVRDRAMLARIEPPPGTDVRAVRWENDPAPILLGTLDMDSDPGK